MITAAGGRDRDRRSQHVDGQCVGHVAVTRHRGRPAWVPPGQCVGLRLTGTESVPGPGRPAASEVWILILELGRNQILVPINLSLKVVSKYQASPGRPGAAASAPGPGGALSGRSAPCVDRQFKLIGNQID
jgi:hypothetical protein